jgi:ribosome-associated protein
VELSFDVAASGAFGPVQRARVEQRLARRLVHGVVTIAASEQRSQLRNREAAGERLVAILSEATAPPPKPRRPTKPSAGAQARRLDEKTRRSQTKRLRRSTDD